MPHHFELRFTDGGRAALADGANRGIRAVSYTRIAAGSGFGPGGAADDGRAALRNERDSAAVTGTTAVAGELALIATIEASADYDIREIGLWGRIGADGPEALHAFWTDPEEIFDRALTGLKTVVAGAFAVATAAAKVRVDASASVTLESQGLLPTWLLPPPHAATADHRLAVTGAAAANGGTVAVSAGQKLSIAVPSEAGDTGFARAFETPIWASQDLDANATHYLRAQVSASGALALYVQQGADADAVPGSLRGTPGAAAGGGFASTALDARIARIATGAAGGVPAVVRYALDATRPAGIAAWSAAADYPHPSAAWGSDNALYTSVQASGPSAAGGAADPAKDADRSHWRPALLVAGLHEIAAPKKDDMVRVGIHGAPAPGKDGWVQIQKLPGALAPSGGTAVGKKYGLKKLADGAYELSTITAAAMILAAYVDLRPTAMPAVLGSVLSVPAGTYRVLGTAAWGELRNSGSAPRLDVALQWRAGGAGAWADVSGLTTRTVSHTRSPGQLFSASPHAHLAYRVGWVVSGDIEVRLLATISGGRHPGYARVRDAALFIAEEP